MAIIFCAGGPQYGTCYMSSCWHLEFWGDSWIFQETVNPRPNCLQALQLHTQTCSTYADSCSSQQAEPPDNVRVPSGLQQPGLSKNLTVQKWECQDHFFGGGGGTTAFVYKHTFKPFQNTIQVLYLENSLRKHGHSWIRGGGGGGAARNYVYRHYII
jgi:hypothetical protein